MEQKEIVAEEKIVSKSTGIGILIVDERQVYMARLWKKKVIPWSHGICGKDLCHVGRRSCGAQGF